MKRVVGFYLWLDCVSLNCVGKTVCPVSLDCIWLYITSIAHRIENPLRRTSEHIAIIYHRIFTAFCLFLNLKEYDMYLSYHTYSYIGYITMHFLNKFSLDNDLILVHRKICHKLITLEDLINLHNINSMYTWYLVVH